MTLFAKKLLFLSLLLVIAACGGGGGDSSGDSSGGDFSLDACSSINLKVANGQVCQPATTTVASPVVKLVVVDLEDNTALCTGTALSQNAILTAAHCFIGGAKAVQIETSFSTLFADSVTAHPGFSVTSAGAFFNDVAIVTTSTPLNIEVSPLLLSRAPIVSEEAIVAGFGETGSDVTARIRAGNLRVANVTANHIFGEFSGEQSSPCKGDSGGPLYVSQNNSIAVVGVVSQSDPSVSISDICKTGDVTLYASVQDPSIQSFILTNVPSAQTL